MKYIFIAAIVSIMTLGSCASTDVLSQQDYPNFADLITADNTGNLTVDEDPENTVSPILTSYKKTHIPEAPQPILRQRAPAYLPGDPQTAVPGLRTPLPLPQPPASSAAAFVAESDKSEMASESVTSTTAQNSTQTSAQVRPPASAPMAGPNEVTAPARVAESRSQDTGSGDSEPVHDALRMDVVPDAGGRIELHLHGLGWIFLSSDIRLDFVSKASEEDGERFVFQLPPGYAVASDEGSAALSFQRQDLEEGVLLSRTVELNIASSDQQTMAEEKADPEILNSDSGLEAGSDSVNALPVSLSRPDETAGLDPASLEALARSYRDSGDTARALSVLDQLELNHPAYLHRDRVQFLRATILEMPGAHRDLRQSMNLYEDLVRVFPYSEYAGRAGDRMRYIQRSFLRVF